MKTHSKENVKYFLIAIFILICWYILHFIYPYFIELILNNLEKFVIFLFFLGILHFIKLIIKKDFIGIRNVLLTLLIIFLFIYSVPIITYQTKILPNGTKIMMHRLTKQLSFKPLNSNIFYIISPSGDVIVKDMENNEKLYSFSSIVYSNIYKYYFNILKNK